MRIFDKYKHDKGKYRNVFIEHLLKIFEGLLHALYFSFWCFDNPMPSFVHLFVHYMPCVKHSHIFGQSLVFPLWLHFSFLHILHGQPIKIFLTWLPSFSISLEFSSDYQTLTSVFSWGKKKKHLNIFFLQNFFFCTVSIKWHRWCSDYWCILFAMILRI